MLLTSCPDGCHSNTQSEIHMSSNHYFSTFHDLTEKRAVEATVSILGITNPKLRNHIIQQFRSPNRDGTFLSDPVFEAIFPWESGSATMEQLAGDLLLPSLVQSMDSAGFSKTIHPFTHQITAWEALLNEKKSIVVTSGTGSGKTECFMVPILNDLASEYEKNNQQLVGVRALFIYPLNALINSQRERLRDWTEKYGDGLRFCLYNGNTPNYKHKDQGKYPNEILTRKILRDTPAPLLVTNATMLEYMLVRQVDAPIIEQSKGKLRWVVLDEAHTYLGSQAAELSLLLRRVLYSFEVEAKDVRFIATSATIGDEKSEANLQSYLANLAGISTEQVQVIGGQRSVPGLGDTSSHQARQISELRAIDPDAAYSASRYQALKKTTQALALRQKLSETRVPPTLSTLAEHLFGDHSRTRETLDWVDLCSSTSLPGSNEKKPESGSTPFLPLRGHFLHQVVNGLWCCVNKHCTAKKGSDLAENWPFGFVYTRRQTQCECGAPVYELVFCNDCNSPHLLAAEHNGRAVQLDRQAFDEFNLDLEMDETSEDDNESRVNTFEKIIIGNRPHPERTYEVSIDTLGNYTTPGMETFDIAVLDPGHLACVNCEYSLRGREFYRRALLGTPFYISNSMPSLLDACSEGQKPSELPSRGRRLITFTDSRQGTARISTKLQQDSERDSIRSLVYGQCASNVHSISSAEKLSKQAELAKMEERVKKFKSIDENDLAIATTQLAENIRQELASYGKARMVDWSEMINKLQSSQDLSRWIFNYYKNLNPVLFPESGGARVLSELLLLREFSRRPKRQNSLETLGLISVRYPALDSISEVPNDWRRLQLDLDDWKSFLKTFLDFYIRENTIIDIPADWIDWMGSKIYPKSVIRPDSDETTSSRVMRWPKVHKGRQGRMVRLLAASSRLSFTDPGDVDIINSIMTSAWLALTKSYQVKDEDTGQFRVRQILRSIAGTVTYSLCREEIAFQACTEAWKCPITHRLLDNTFKDITPYLPNNATENPIKCEKVSIPICRINTAEQSSEAQRKTAIRNWIGENSEIETLRSENLWTDVSDRVLEGGSFYRVAEHSAQQPAHKLELYESLFKLGKLNVLSCSTTMELGVDIGGISVVAMNNVPPHPANYLQRAGRAGRRGETQALAFSICKDNPHERSVFSNPQWPFVTTIPAPYITLNSERIVQRHVNSLLLAIFLRHVIKISEIEATSLTCEWFFYSEPEVGSRAERMVRWLESFQIGAVPFNLEAGIGQVIKGSALAGISILEIIRRSITALQKASESWLPGFIKLKNQLAELQNLSESDPFRRKVNFDLKSMGKDYLLSELATRAYLPGYGFPSGVVTFDHYSISDFKRGRMLNAKGRIDNQARLRERPARDLPTALREYAPGAQIVLDGLCYRSAGILLNKFSPNESFTEPQKMLVEWRCHKCGAIGNESSSVFNQVCSECGSGLEQSNIREFIEPDGFAVDFYSAPTIDITSQAYIPMQEPWVSAGSELNSLFDPRIGSYRASAQGHIFHHSSGEYGTGFAVCLRCGKAESMTAAEEYPTHLQPGRDHTRLQGKPGPEHSAMCEGSDEAYAIKKSVHLGTINQTDVFELNLKRPNEGLYIKHVNNDPLPWTLAVVFRQVLADIQGINAEEMGYMVKPTALPDCDYPVASIVLYDKSAGGAGFASSAIRYLPEMIERALSYLDCPDACESACQSCLLGYDTRFHTDVMDRHVAVEFIHTLLPYLKVPEEAQIFGTATRSCFESLGAELLAAANHGASNVRIITSGKFVDWNISASELKTTCLNLLGIFNQVQLVLPSTKIRELSEEHKEDLLALSNFGIKICQLGKTERMHVPHEQVLAQVDGGEVTVTFGTNGDERNLPGFNWWRLEDCFLVESPDIPAIPVIEIDPQVLKPAAHAGDVEIELRGECDGPISHFGTKLWTTILSKSPSLSKKLSSDCKLERVTYSDCYICSPWSLMLLGEAIDKLRSAAGEQWDETKFTLLTSNKPPNMRARGYYSEWSDNQIKSDICSQYFDDMGIPSKVHIKNIREMPHGRAIKLTWEDGSFATIRFDHGFGCWSIDGKTRDWFDIQAEADSQVNQMYSAISHMKAKYSKRFPTQIFVKAR